MSIDKNTSLYFLDRYVNLDKYYQAFSTAFFKTSSINFQIKTIDASSTSSTADTAPKGNVFIAASFSVMYYQYVSISNVKWNIDLNGFSAEDK